MKRALIVLIGIGLLGLSCSSLEKLVLPPSVKVENVGISDISMSSIGLNFNLLVHNPNVFGVQLDGYGYSFAVEGQEFLSGDESQQMQISASASNSIMIPLTVDFQRLYDLASNTKSLDSLSYRISGHFRPGGLLSGMDVPFSKSGSVPNVRLPKISFDGIRIEKMGFSGVDLNVGLNVDNNNIFGFDLGQLNYTIALAGAQVANGVTEDLASIPPKESGRVSIPISLSFMGMASSLRTILGGQTVECEINGSTALETPFGSLNLPIDTKQNVRIFK